MYKWLYIMICINVFENTIAQKRFQKIFPKSAITLQFAGSTGFVTFGFSKITRNDKIEVGLLYGTIPRVLGKVNHSLSIKGIYSPFKFNVLKKIEIQPFQTGLFICQNFGETLGLTWSNKYPKGYYWWPRSLRIHYFVSSQLSYKIEKKHIERISCYFEANTNDLYIYSYFPNRGTISLYDIFFFGIGIKLYIK